MTGPCRAGVAALVLVAAWVLPSAPIAADRPAVSVDLSVLDALDAPDDAAAGPDWVPPLPGRRPVPPMPRARTIAVEPVEAPAPAADPRPAPPARLTPAPIMTTDPVLWRRPIPVTASVYLVQQAGARSTAPTLTTSEKLVGANVDVEATADMISALPNGDGFRMLFVDDGTALSETGERLLDTLAERMGQHADLRLSVMAYAGGTPDTAARSRLLSLERGLAVRNYLFDRGVRGSRIDVRALGNTYVDGPPERVDLLLVD